MGFCQIANESEICSFFVLQKTLSCQRTDSIGELDLEPHKTLASHHWILPNSAPHCPELPVVNNELLPAMWCFPSVIFFRICLCVSLAFSSGSCQMLPLPANASEIVYNPPLGSSDLSSRSVPKLTSALVKCRSGFEPDSPTNSHHVCLETGLWIGVTTSCVPIKGMFLLTAGCYP